MIDYLEHHIVDHCNLNCAGCSHFSPLATSWYETKEQFTHDFTILANKTERRVGMIRLMGGEPLLHRDVAWFAQKTRELFPKADIQVVTNGILLEKRKDELVDIFNENDIRVCVSNYGLNVDLHRLVDGFKLSRVDWKEEMYHIGLKESGADGAKAFENCDLHQHKWYFFQDGRFYQCCIGANVFMFNKWFEKKLPVPEGITISDHSIEEVEEFLSKPCALCGYCDTLYRARHEHEFARSSKEIGEWICQ